MTVKRIFDILDNFATGKFSERNILAARNQGVWSSIKGKEYVEIVDLLSLGFLEKGISRGVKVATVLRNTPEWNFIDMALLQVGAIQVPVYQNISTQNYQFIFADTEVEYIFVSDQVYYENVREAIEATPSIKVVYSIEETDTCESWQKLLKLGQESLRNEELQQLKESVTENDLASIIYTSGTTGTPKGVMLTHKNIVSNFMALSHILAQHPVNRVLSFLPLCHVLERIMNYTYQVHGATIYYCINHDHLSDYIRDIRPQMLTAVPRVLEKIYEKIIRKGRSFKGIKRLIFAWSVKVGEKYEPWARKKLLYRIKLFFAQKLVLNKWKSAFGDELEVIVCGGASLQERISHVFWAAGFWVMEGYGLTETSPVIAVSNFLKDGVRIGTVGPVLPGNEIKIADDGEILTKGPNVTIGYYKRPDLTKEAIDSEGWFHTGDIGFLENEYLRITDRKKEIFKTSGGKYISPQQIENKLKESPFIENAMVVGEGKKYAATIIVPDFNYVESWYRIKGYNYLGPNVAITDRFLINRFQREIDHINRNVDHIQQIKRFALVPEVWNVETGELSPTMKLKRKELLTKYASLIEKLYRAIRE